MFLEQNLEHIPRGQRCFSHGIQGSHWITLIEQFIISINLLTRSAVCWQKGYLTPNNMIQSNNLRKHVYVVTARHLFLAALAAAAFAGCNGGGSGGGSGPAAPTPVSSRAPASLPVGSYFAGGNTRFDVKAPFSAGATGLATIMINGISSDYNCTYNPNGSAAFLYCNPIGTGGGRSPFTAVFDNWMAAGGNITSVQTTGLPNVPGATTMTAGGTPIPGNFSGTENPGSQPGNPGSQPGNPGSQPGNPGSQPGNPGSQPVNPPGSQPENPVARPPQPVNPPGSQPAYPTVPSNSRLYESYQLLQSIRQSKPHWTNPPLPPSGTGVLPPQQYGYEICIWAAANARNDGDRQAAEYFDKLAEGYRALIDQLTSGYYSR